VIYCSVFIEAGGRVQTRDMDGKIQGLPGHPRQRSQLWA
jgi:hypothetical protein